ncbi:MAG TPA: NAD-dependent epimerase/dehydratase family protein [Acidimicrobiales bacterium]|nr:NAD-dependent epimerase/dehydratase family protein [Acidimicrobiales bacterium]
MTGGSGFIGRQVVRHFTERGDDVTVLDLVQHRDPSVNCVVGDICDPEAVGRAMGDGTDAVVHLAALTSVLESVKDPHGVFRTNVVGVETVLEQCRQRGVRSFVLSSTNAVVGNVGREVINEKTDLHPLTPYGATKAAGEMIMSAYTAAYGIHCVALRFTNVYGIGMQTKDSVVARLMKVAMSGGSVPVYGSGEQARDYLFVLDAVGAIELGLGLGRGEVLTIGAGESVSMIELHRTACEVTGVDIPIEHIPEKPGEMPAVIVETDKARAAGFELKYDLREGLTATWDDFRENPA